MNSLSEHAALALEHEEKSSPNVWSVDGRPCAKCRSCYVFNRCLPGRLDPASVAKLESIATHRRHLPRGAYLFRSGSRFGSLFVLRTGCLKTVLTQDDGRFRVSGFHAFGDLVGLDGIGTGQHQCDAISLECDVCEFPFAALDRLAAELPQLQRYLFRLMSSELVQDQAMMLLLGTMRADERVAVFLLNLAKRHGAIGFSTTRFQLRMSRADIGSYLGLKLETVSRVLTHLRLAGLIAVNGPEIAIVDPAGLAEVIGAHELASQSLLKVLPEATPERELVGEAQGHAKVPAADASVTHQRHPPRNPHAPTPLECVG